ncbi:pyridoxal-phosphate dependent enzyme [Anaerofilum sp. BX8]|uniref:Pyridoxal-phosphate dependent enzyme n=1 Tax=Anaerofilum hominis TaxID=2763016 RepID=A0A923IEP4_9FIRM|nr:pyridoxal-phosphate dependent enzyme [Anaerofilum hominis]MBC5581237.1 pyridoxal-phosphate dependent enzyme [Anaerofilum hominis]
MGVYHDYTQARGAGVLVRAGGLAARYRLEAELLCFVNFFGPTDSFKDSLAEGMIRMAEQSGALAPGALITEAASGSFAAALALAGYRTGHPVTLCLPATAPLARQKQLAALGAKLALCNYVYGRAGCEKRAAEIAAERGGYFMDHYANDLNPEYHRRVTGPAILQATDARLDFIVAGVGSGGTISGVGEHVKAWTNGVQIVAVEPYESQVLSGGFAGQHGLAGLGCGFVPENYNPYIVDKIVPVSTGDGKKLAGEALLCDGLPLCPASGAVLAAALELARAPENRGKRIVALTGGKVSY